LSSSTTPATEPDAAANPVERAPIPPRSPELDAATDAVILTAATSEWVKIAVLIARATDALRAQSMVATPPIIALRIYALIANGQLEVTGNMRRWRAAVVRLKG
jgi:Protein of unknown function